MSDVQQSQEAATVDHLRETAADRVEKTSLRSVAREIGMSPTGLKKFLLGTAPYSPTLRRLRKWYITHAVEAGDEVGKPAASAALAVLTSDLAPEARRGAFGGIVDLLARAYDQSGRQRPAWLMDLRTG